MAKKETKKAAVSDKGPAKSDKDKKLNDLVAALRKDFGDGAVFHGDLIVKDVETVSSGSLTLDLCMGIGGFPLGRIVEIYGPESSGKTTLTLHAIASAQKAGLKCAFIDAEHALDPKYAASIGVNIKDLIISQPDNGEQALEIMKHIAASGAVQVIVVDSVAALVPKVELEGDFDKANMGLHARMMSKAMRTLTGDLNRNGILAIFINQIRMKIGVMYGNPQTTTGGEALKYYASMRLTVRQGEKFKDGDRIVGGTMIVKLIKNKLSTPFTECEIPVIYGQGFDKVGDIYTVAKEFGILDVRGAHHYFEGEKFASKKDEALEFLKNDPKFVAKIDKKVREEYKKRVLAGDLDIPSVATEEDRLEAEEVAPEDDE